MLVTGAAVTAVVPATGASPLARHRHHHHHQHHAVTAHVQFATYNTRAQVPTRKAVHDVVRLSKTGADVITLQEMSNPQRRKEVLAKLVTCGGCAFRAYMPRSAVPGGTPILYREKRFELLKAGTKLVAEAEHVGSRGAGPATLRARYVNWVHLRERRTDRSVYVLNNHAVPSVQAHGGPNKKMRKRLDMYRHHMRGLQELVVRFKHHGGKVFVAGDLNVNYRGDRLTRAHVFPYYRLGKVGLRASYRTLGEPKRGTHVLSSGNANRLIDYVYYLPRPAVEPVAQHVLGGYASDHRPLFVEFAFHGRR